MYSQLSHSEVGPRSSEFKVPQVEQEVVMGVGDPQSAPRVGTVDAEIVFKPTTGMATFISVSSDRPDPPRPTPYQARSTCPHDRNKPPMVDKIICVSCHE